MAGDADCLSGLVTTDGFGLRADESVQVAAKESASTPIPATFRSKFSTRGLTNGRIS